MQVSSRSDPRVSMAVQLAAVVQNRLRWKPRSLLWTSICSWVKLWGLNLTADVWTKNMDLNGCSGSPNLTLTSGCWRTVAACLGEWIWCGDAVSCRLQAKVWGLIIGLTFCRTPSLLRESGLTLTPAPNYSEWLTVAAILGSDWWEGNDSHKLYPTNYWCLQIVRFVSNATYCSHPRSSINFHQLRIAAISSVIFIQCEPKMKRFTPWLVRGIGHQEWLAVLEVSSPLS